MSDSIAPKTFGIFANSSARKIIAALENQNADVLVFSPIEIEKINLSDSDIATLGKLNEFDWLIFTDAAAVDFFLENLAENNIDSFELDNLRICAVGETVADQLRFSSIHSDVVPANTRIDSILTAIADYAGEKNFANLRILFPKGKSADENLLERLREKAATVQILNVYEARLKNDLETAKLKTLLTNGAIDEFIFTAPTDFIFLKYSFKDTDFSEIFSEIKISAADSATALSAREINLSPVSLFFIAKT